MRPTHLFRLLVPFELLIAGCGEGGSPNEPELVVPGRLEANVVDALGTVGTALSALPTVTLRDTRGRPLAGAVVSFQVSAGGGSIDRSNALTGPDGTASGGRWTLGPRPGTNTLEVTTAGVAPVSFSVVAAVGQPASLEAHPSNPVEGVVGQQLAPGPAVVVRDALGNPVPGQGVSFVPGEGSGQLAQSAAITDTAGVARADWTLGTTPGSHTLRALLGTLTATVTVKVAAGDPAALEQAAGNGQSATVARSVPTPPAVAVRDRWGNPVAGVAVQFSVTGGGGQVVGGSAVTDAAGLARAAAWTLGTRVGANTLVAGVPGLPPVAFTATATPDGPARVEKVAGDGQSGVIGTLLPVAPAVAVSDSFGNPVPGVQVTFSTSDGTLTGALALSDAEGVARLGGWRLGTTAGPQTLEARVGDLAVSFGATARPGPPASLHIVAGQDQVAVVGSATPVRPAVRVRDSGGNDLAGVEVRFAPGSSGGMVTGAVVHTGPDGVAEVGGWTLGTAAGSYRLTATVTGAPQAVFLATAVAGAPARLLKVAGDGQVATPGTPLPISPTVRVLDVYGNPVRAVPIGFTVSGGGRLEHPDTATSADGTATAGTWVLATLPGTNNLAVEVAGLGAVVFSAIGTAAEPPASPYRIELRFLDEPNTVQREAFTAAVQRWQRVIAADLPDEWLNIGAGDCGSGTPALNESVDDLLVFVLLESIDGAGGTLGSAGPCYVRGGSWLPVLGRMRFDTADLLMLELNGRLQDVILHELGHVLGFGTTWSLAGLIQGAGGPDPYFSGAGAKSRFLLAGGSITPGSGVPVENSGGAGTQDAHWRESVLGNELMTGWISGAGTSNPLSAITIASLTDLGYSVDLSAADPFTLAGGSGFRLDEAVMALVEEPLPPPRVLR